MQRRLWPLTATVAFLVLVAAITAVGTAVSIGASEDFTVEVFPHADPEIRFSNDWGDPRSGGRSHQGTDIFSPKGSPVVAIADGFVEYVQDWPRAGFALIIRHADGWSSHYYHLNNDTPGTDDGKGGFDAAFAPGIGEGVFVHAGDVVGYVGDSGNAEPSSPHTHFELHYDGRPVNPYSYLAEAFERETLLAELEVVGTPID